MAIPKLTFTVTAAQTAAFAKAWDSGGIKIILDQTSIQFATDWANIALKSFVADMAAQVAKVAEAKLAAQKAHQTSPENAAQTDAVATQAVPSAPQGGIILTD